LLLLVFLQKTGAGLLFHNLVHAKAVTSEHAVPKDGDKGISYACSCIDDFLVPFTAAEEQLPLQVTQELFTPAAHDVSAIPFNSPVYSSLRGPPAIVIL